MYLGKEEEEVTNELKDLQNDPKPESEVEDSDFVISENEDEEGANLERARSEIDDIHSFLGPKDVSGSATILHKVAYEENENPDKIETKLLRLMEKHKEDKGYLKSKDEYGATFLMYAVKAGNDS